MEDTLRFVVQGSISKFVTYMQVRDDMFLPCYAIPVPEGIQSGVY